MHTRLEAATVTIAEAPWYVGSEIAGQGLLVFGADGAVVANCGFRHIHTRKIQKAHARLIAAAPDLFTALENLVACDLWQDRPEMQQAREAIKKAKGEL